MPWPSAGGVALRDVVVYSKKERFPAMVAAITDSRGEFLAGHRTWLSPQPNGSVVKAAVAEPKKTLGPYRGGAIRLWRGDSAKPWANMPMHSTIVIGEGIEDALTAMTGADIAFPGRRPGVVSAPVAVSKLRVIAAVSIDNMAAIELPPQIDRAVILQQHDQPGSSAARKLDTIISHIEEQGVDVLLVPPPAWVGIKDINDAMRALRPIV